MPKDESTGEDVRSAWDKVMSLGSGTASKAKKQLKDRKKQLEEQEKKAMGDG